MKKLILIMSVLLVTLTSYSQWAYTTVDNGLDEPYKIAYVGKSKVFLKLENVDGVVAFYIIGNYTCDEYPMVDIAFYSTKTGYVKFNISSRTAQNKEAVFIIDDVTQVPGFIEAFNAATSVKVRINESYCDTDTYEFDMGGSATALKFMMN